MACHPVRILLALAVALLAGCGGGTEAVPTEAPAAARAGSTGGAWLACLAAGEAAEREGRPAELACLHGHHAGRDAAGAACALGADPRGWTLEQGGRRVRVALASWGEDDRGAPVNNLEASGLPGGAGLLLSQDLEGGSDDEPVAESLALRAMPAVGGRPARAWVTWMRAAGERRVEARCELLP